MFVCFQRKEEDRLDFFGKPFMKLQCPQCSTKCITFKEYVQHLYQPTHIKAMRDKSVQLKVTLAKMRMAQRAKQKKADEEDLTSLNTRTIFCPICKLNYSQDKSVHQTSEAHKVSQNFSSTIFDLFFFFFIQLIANIGHLWQEASYVANSSISFEKTKQREENEIVVAADFCRGPSLGNLFLGCFSPG